MGSYKSVRHIRGSANLHKTETIIYTTKFGGSKYVNFIGRSHEKTFLIFTYQI